MLTLRSITGNKPVPWKWDTYLGRNPKEYGMFRSHRMLYVLGRWRRMLTYQISSTGTCYVRIKNKLYVVEDSDLGKESSEKKIDWQID
jgi:hypothetical protein